jgi:DNA gyrase/topoisomerase IV subunit A
MSTEDDEWVDIESKLNKKIDTLQTIIQQQHDLLQLLSKEMKALKEEIHSTHHTSSHKLSLQHDRTHELLEELRISRHRELNMALREKIPIPFSCNGNLLGHGLFSKRMPLSPHFLGRRVAPDSTPTSFSL